MGFFPPSSVSNLVSKVSDMDKLVSCLPVDSGTLGLEGLDMRTLQMSSRLQILEDLLSLPSPQLHLQDYLNFFSHFIIIICSHHASRRIRLPCSQSNTVHFAHPALLLGFYAVFLQVVSVLPLALLPSGTYPNAVK